MLRSWNLYHPVELIIPRDPSFPIPPMSGHNVTNLLRLFQYHQTQLKPMSSIHIELQPLKQNLSYPCKKICNGVIKNGSIILIIFLASGKTDYNRLEMQKIIDSAWFSIKIDFNRLKSNWLSSIVLEIQPHRLKSNWWSSIMLEIEDHWLKPNRLSSVMLGIIGKSMILSLIIMNLLKIDRNQSI